MSTIITFRSRADLAAEDNLKGFVAACKNELTVFGAELPFDEDTWDVTDAVKLKSQGAARHRLIFTNLASAGTRSPQMMPEPFRSFAKAYMRYMFGLRSTKAINHRLVAFRVLESALADRIGHSDPLFLTADDFNRAAQTAQQKYSVGVAVSIGRTLETLARFLTEQRLTFAPIHWRNFLKNSFPLARVGKEFDERRKEKLPSQAALEALPQIFRAATEPKDIFVTSVTALLCASPDRISEVLHLPVDCEVSTKRDDGEPAYGLRWWPAKGADPMVKWVIPSMWSVVKEALQNIRRITEPAREVARWYEAHPTSMFLPEGHEHLRKQEWLNMKELGVLLGMDNKTSPHVWCHNASLNVVMEKHRRKVRFRDVEKTIIGMLPKWFPLLHPDSDLRYSDALCIVRRHELGLAYGTYLCAIEPVTTNQINVPLGSCTGNRFRSIFDRHGYTEPDGSPIRVSTHQFRHYLNTLAQAGGLSDIDIAKWSGRRDVKQNEAYDHVTADQMLVKVRQAIGESSQLFGPLAELPANLPVSRDDFGRLRAPTAHTTEFGFCIHDYTMSPCQLHRDCLSCRDHVCVKGDTVKQKRLEDRLVESRQLLRDAEEANAEGYAGSDRWLDHHRTTVARLQQLVDFMNNPNVPVGAVIQLAPPASPNAVASTQALATRAPLVFAAV